MEKYLEEVGKEGERRGGWEMAGRGRKGLVS